MQPAPRAKTPSWTLNSRATSLCSPRTSSRPWSNTATVLWPQLDGPGTSGCGQSTVAVFDHGRDEALGEQRLVARLLSVQLGVLARGAGCMMGSENLERPGPSLRGEGPGLSTRPASRTDPRS